MEEKANLWLPLALGRRHWDGASELQALGYTVSRLLPGSPAEEAAASFVGAGPGECIGRGLDLIRELEPELMLGKRNRSHVRELADFTRLILACSGDHESAGLGLPVR